MKQVRERLDLLATGAGRQPRRVGRLALAMLGGGCLAAATYAVVVSGQSRPLPQTSDLRADRLDMRASAISDLRLTPDLGKAASDLRAPPDLQVLKPKKKLIAPGKPPKIHLPRLAPPADERTNSTPPPHPPEPDPNKPVEQDDI